MRIRTSYANVVSTLALALALSGGAYAATQLPKNSVGAKQLQKNAVSAKKVKDGSLTVADLGAGQVAAGVSGTPMGGGLTGSFPNPQVNVGALTGVLKGTAYVNRVTLAPGASDQSLLVLPGVGTFGATCTGTPNNNVGLVVRYLNTTGSTMTYTRVKNDEAGSSGTLGVSVAAGDQNDTSFQGVANNLIGRALTQSFTTGPLAVVDVGAHTSSTSGVAGCVVTIRAVVS